MGNVSPLRESFDLGFSASFAVACSFPKEQITSWFTGSDHFCLNNNNKNCPH